MKVNYVLMYGTPYLKYREFEKFDDISKFLINKGIVNYRIFELMEDKKEVEMIYLQNDIKVLEKENKQLKEDKKKAIEILNKLNIKLKDILQIGIDIKEINVIKQILGDKI